MAGPTGRNGDDRGWSSPTPNGHKVQIALEELGMEYKIISVNIGAGDQFRPEFLKITPNHRIPAIVDPQLRVAGFQRPVSQPGFSHMLDRDL
jgi:Glutathione S-transferase, N-terminal domain